MLPSVSTVPLFEHALRVRAPVYHSASGHHVFPVTSDSGCVALIDLQPQVPLDAKQVSIIQSLVGVYRNQVTLLDYSETDSLTGLLNRKTYDVRFYESAQAHAAAEQVSPLAPERRAAAQHSWIGVIDLDHFKRVNDTHGHLIGDELLLMVAQLMRASFRYGDELFRFGGEEFVVLLRAPDAAHARRAFERFRANLAQQVFPRVGHVSASLGFTQVGEADSPSDAFGRADRAVYFAKQNGRNQVCCFEELLAGGALSAPVHVGEVELF
jgi:diguanylate cyclase (GGDEF)-like protein